MDILIESQYFPSLAYFKAIASCDRLIIDDKELFNKQTYRNRCTILGANGAMDLIAPVSHLSQRKMSKIELDHKARWAAVHKRSIESAYGRSPYFEYFADEILSTFNEPPAKLIELNTAILSKIFKILELESDILLLSEINDFDEKNTLNLKETIHPKKKEKDAFYTPYQQVFGTQHQYNLSVLDAIFCIGKETIGLLY